MGGERSATGMREGSVLVLTPVLVLGLMMLLVVVSDVDSNPRGMELPPLLVIKRRLPVRVPPA